VADLAYVEPLYLTFDRLLERALDNAWFRAEEKSVLTQL
jgi:hypothetical protein